MWTHLDCCLTHTFLLKRVPTKFHYGAILRDDLIDAAKVKVVPQAVDTDLFRPMKVSRKGKTFRFLSVFKWERRKGWDVLLRAFIEEFDADKDDVELVIKTSGEKIF